MQQLGVGINSGPLPGEQGTRESVWHLENLGLTVEYCVKIQTHDVNRPTCMWAACSCAW